MTAGRRTCQICGKPLVRYQRVACSTRCASRMKTTTSGNGHAVHSDATKAAGLRLWMVRPQLSATAIGAMMVPQLTKNSVVGMAHRYEWPPRPSPIRRDGEPRALGPRWRPVPAPHGPTLPALASATVVAARKGPTPPAKPPQRAPEPPAAPPAPKRRPEAEMLLPRAGTPPRWGFCQYATTSTKPYLWCGDPAVPNSPYCDEHDKLCRPRRSWLQAERESVAA